VNAHANIEATLEPPAIVRDLFAEGDEADAPLIGVPEWEPILDRTRAILPLLRERADETRANRRVPDQNMQLLYDHRILRYLQPERFGGEVLPWGVQFHIGRIIARACPATAWLATVVATHMFYAGRFSPQAQEDLFASGDDALIGMASAPVGVTSRRVEGGHNISGRWKFVSGVDHEFCILLPVVPNLEDRTNGYMMMVYHSQVSVEDNWQVTGLQGTGSKDVVLHDVFVPDHRALPFPDYFSANPPGALPQDPFIRRRPLKGYYGSATLGPLIGMAEAALVAYLSVTRRRVGAMARDAVAEHEIVQIRIADSLGEVKAARLLVEQQLDMLRRLGQSDEDISDIRAHEINRDRATAARLCLDAVDRVARSMGAFGVFSGNPVHAPHQDLRAAASQIALDFDRNMTAYGRVVLGLEAKLAI
jgi:3-hydroxy-9,10-secoandrosta-1,3,5(10)-triene-9,17-dione monooxygenase